MAYWKSWAFHCSGKAFLHALLYFSIIGGVLIWVCRWLHPVPEEVEVKHEYDVDVLTQEARHAQHPVIDDLDRVSAVPVLRGAGRHGHLSVFIVRQVDSQLRLITDSLSQLRRSWPCRLM